MIEKEIAITHLSKSGKKYLQFEFWVCFSFCPLLAEGFGFDTGFDAESASILV